MPVAPAPRERVETGSLYRLVPNWSTHWDYERDTPEPRAFRKDGDVGVSMLRSDRITPEDIFHRKPNLKEFAICGILVADLIADGDVWVESDPDDDFGDAHALVMGITKRRIDWLRDLGARRIIKRPGPAKLPSSHDGD